MGDVRMINRWNDDEAHAWLREAGEEEAERDLALRIYTSRLIGGETDLVLHGGGNTSVKTRRRTAGGDLLPVLHVKGSGWDLGSIEAPGLPALELAPLCEARSGAALTDPQMVALLRANLLDPASPNPSIETLLHAFLPAKYVDHSHAAAVLALVNQPDAAAIGRRLYGRRLAIVPYVMPGYDLSIEAARIFDAHPDCEGLWLVNHGLFTFGETARQSYERMIEFVNIAEVHLAEHGVRLVPPLAPRGDTAESRAFRDRLSARIQAAGPAFASGVSLDFRADAAIDTLLQQPDLVEITGRGTITPDHVIRVKPFPLVLEGSESAEELDAALADFARRYERYFEVHAAQASEPKTMLDPLPRVILVRGMGLFGAGKSAGEAKIVADLASQTARVIQAAEAYGRFTPLPTPDLFDMEYWSLEQAKLQGKG